MKVLLMSFFLLSNVAFASDANRAAQSIIRTYGYTCDTVDAITPFLMGGGYDVYCNGFKYHFEIVDHGGKIIVRVKG